MQSVGKLESSVLTRGAREPSLRVLFALGLVGFIGAAGATALRLTSDHGGEEPGLQAALLDWIILSYVLSGLVAWRQRPDSRFGPLMIAAGFLTALTGLSSASAALPFTVGQALDLVPVALFLHVFLAFPTGRLQGRAGRMLVAATYAVAVGMQLVGMALGGFGPDNLLAVAAATETAAALSNIQLTALAVMSLAGIAVLAARRRSAGPPLRRSASLLVVRGRAGHARCTSRHWRVL